MSDEPEREPQTRQLIARRLAVGFGSVSFVAIVMCAILLSLIGEVADLVMDMRGDEVAIKESLSLAMAVREQYMHQAHWIIEQDDEHLKESDQWLRRVEQGIRVLRPLVPVPASAAPTCATTTARFRAEPQTWRTKGHCCATV